VTTILLVRHGQTDAVNRYIAGTAEGTPLNREGRLQAERLAETLRDVPLAAVVASPLTRTRETAEPIARAHGLDIETVSAFAEFEFGAWTGRTFSDIESDPLWHQFNAVRSLTRAPGGELMLEVQQRAVAGLLELADSRPDAHVLVVSHGDVIRAALMYFLGVPLDHVHRLEVSPAGISIVTLDAHGPVVRQVNGDTAAGAR
jgi:probable phosphomutase (TIGR03848 family)